MEFLIMIYPVLFKVFMISVILFGLIIDHED